VWKRFFLSLLLLLCSFSLFAQAGAEQSGQSLTQLSSTINGKLLNLKAEINSLQTDLTSTTASLAQASQDLRISETERREWEAKSTTLSASLESISAELSDSLQTITVYKTRLERLNRDFLIFGIVGLVIILAKFAAFLLYAKGVKTPRWLDIIL
jgi:septal ring factor EnvC (AmiA/AmiB activator)